MKIPTEYQDRYMWPKWLRIIQAVLLVFNALLVILAVFTCTFSPIFVTNVLWAGFFGWCTYQNVKTTNEINTELLKETVINELDAYFAKYTDYVSGIKDLINKDLNAREVPNLGVTHGNS